MYHPPVPSLIDERIVPFILGNEVFGTPEALSILAPEPVTEPNALKSPP